MCYITGIRHIKVHVSFAKILSFRILDRQEAINLESCFANPLCSEHHLTCYS